MPQPRQTGQRLRKGEVVILLAGEQLVSAAVVEDRGPLGPGGQQVVRIRLLDDETAGTEFELPVGRLLTGNEIAVLRAIYVEGLDRAQTARRLGVSGASVDQHMQRILAKLGAWSAGAWSAREIAELAERSPVALAG